MIVIPDNIINPFSTNMPLEDIPIIQSGCPVSVLYYLNNVITNEQSNNLLDIHISQLIDDLSFIESDIKIDKTIFFLAEQKLCMFDDTDGYWHGIKAENIFLQYPISMLLYTNKIAKIFSYQNSNNKNNDICVLGYNPQRYDLWINDDLFINKNRKYSICYIGNTKYRDRPYFADKINTMPHSCVIKNQIPYSQFKEYLRNSWLSFCPEGWGTKTHREIESIILGSVIVKPVCNNAIWPISQDPYIHYLPVKSDLSNIEQILAFAMDNKDVLTTISNNAYEWYQRCCSIEATINIVNKSLSLD